MRRDGTGNTAIRTNHQPWYGREGRTSSMEEKIQRVCKSRRDSARKKRSERMQEKRVYPHITTSPLLQSVMQSITACSTSVGISMTITTLRATTTATAISAKLGQYCILPSILFSCITVHEHSRSLFSYFQSYDMTTDLSLHARYTQPFFHPIFSHYPHHTDNRTEQKKNIIPTNYQPTQPDPSRYSLHLPLLHCTLTSASVSHPRPIHPATIKSKIEKNRTSNIHAHYPRPLFTRAKHRPETQEIRRISKSCNRQRKNNHAI